MKVYKITTYLMCVISMISLMLGIYLNFLNKYGQYDFYTNVFLGIFSSSLITLIASIVGYFVERQKNMEFFWKSIYGFINYLLNYECYSTNNEKLDYLQNYHKSYQKNINKAYGNLSFFQRRKMSFIYNDLYKPVIDLNGKFEKYIKEIGLAKKLNQNPDKIIEKIENLFVKYNRITPNTVKIASPDYFFTDNLENILQDKFYNLMYYKNKKRMNCNEKYKG